MLTRIVHRHILSNRGANLPISVSLRLLSALLIIAASQVVLIAQSDTTPPTLKALSFAASSVTVSTAAQPVTINASVTDDLSGVYYCSIIFHSPSGQVNAAAFKLTTGSSLTGTYAATATFAKFSEAGNWTATMEIADLAGNKATLNPSALESLGFPATMTVVDATPDLTPPALLGVKFTPSSINTTLLPATVTVELQITDSQAGADFTHIIDLAVTLSPTNATSTGPFQYLSTADFRLVSGTAQNGTWQATKVMPLYSGGNWTVSQVILYDAVTNKITVTPAQLSAMGIKPVLVVTSTQADNIPPTLTGLNFAPALINTTGGPATAVISYTATDDLSGLSSIPAMSALGAFDVYLISPSGSQQVHLPPSPVLSVGEPLSGKWQSRTTWPKFSEGGTWSVFYVRVTDAVGNTNIYTSSTLPASTVSSAFVNIEPSYSVDGSVTSAGGIIEDAWFGARASLGFPAGLVSASTAVTIDVLPNPGSAPTPSGFSSAGTFFENVSFSPSLPTPVPAPGIKVVLPLLNQMMPGTSISLYHMDPGSGLSPAMNASGDVVVGMVNPDGYSATFTNVVTFSGLIGYLAGSKPDVNADVRAKLR